MGSHVGVELPFSSSLGYVRVSQEFGEGASRSDYDHGKIDSHFVADRNLYYAIDFAVARGNDVLAQGNGTIIDSRMTVDNGQNTTDGFGNFITIEYVDGSGVKFYATYMHLSRGSVPTTVTLGQAFAKTGDTGTIDSNGPHAHLHVTYGATTVPFHSSTSNVVMADGSLAANPQGAPVFFTATDIRPANLVESRGGFLHENDQVRSDNVNPGHEVGAVVVAGYQTAVSRHYDDMNGWFFGADANPQDSIQYWLIYDGNADTRSGHFVVNGHGLIYSGGQWRDFSGDVPAQEYVLLTGSEMSHAQFLAGDAGKQDPLYVIAWDGHQWSNWGSFWVSSVTG